MTQPPIISRTEQIKMANDIFIGKTLKEIKEQEQLVIFDFGDDGIMVLANPSMIALGLKDEPPKV